MIRGTFEFAKKFGLDIIPVVDVNDPEVDLYDLKEAAPAEGKLINSGEFNGLDNLKSIPKVIDYIEEKESERSQLTLSLGTG